MSVLTDLAQRLVDGSVGTLWNGSTGTIVRGRRIDDPGDTGIFLQTYPGDASRLRNDSNLAADERLNVQVTVRDSNQAAAETLALSAWNAIQGNRLTINSNRYAHIRAVQFPAYLGVDERDRPLVVFNVEVRRHRDSFA